MEDAILNQEQVETLTDALDGQTDANEDENLFSDSIQEEPTEEVVENPVEEPKAEEAITPFLEVTYNKEKRGLNQDEAKTFAQKGMNYDHLNDKYNNLYSPIEKLARLNGMNVEQFLDSLNNTQVEFEKSKEIETLREKFPDAPNELLEQLADKNVTERINSQISKFEDEKKEQVNAQEEAVRRDIETLKTEFPDLDINNLPDEVISLVRDGNHTLVSAYYKYLHNQDSMKLSQAEEKSKIDAINEANKRKSLGNTSNAGEGEKEDAFFIGLNSI